MKRILIATLLILSACSSRHISSVKKLGEYSYRYQWRGDEKGIIANIFDDGVNTYIHAPGHVNLSVLDTIGNVIQVEKRGDHVVFGGRPNEFIIRLRSEAVPAEEAVITVGVHD